jgi:hypothetical protein
MFFLFKLGKGQKITLFEGRSEIACEIAAMPPAAKGDSFEKPPPLESPTKLFIDGLSLYFAS